MIDEMCKILERHQLYVPSISSQTSVTLPNGEVHKMTTTEMLEMLFTGDLLTVVRARSAISIRASHDTTKDQLRGLIPTVEDWHSRMTLMKVSLNM
jgi:L1 cell adhesion molecule like protein